MTFVFRAWREARGWTQQQAAEALGVAKRTVEYLDDRPEVDRRTQLACRALDEGWFDYEKRRP